MKNRASLYFLLALILLVTACSPTKSTPELAPELDYWPTAGWKSATPESQGMDAQPLAEMLEDITADEPGIHSLLVIRNGYLVTEAYFHPYTRDTNIHIQSVTKSVIGMLVGRAIQTGSLNSVEDTLLSFYPERVMANSGAQKSSIRLRHLLSMASGLDCQEFSASGAGMEQSSDWVQFMLDLPMVDEPGKSFGYCNGNAHLLSAVLEKSTGMKARAYANQVLFAPLGIPKVSEADWGADPQGVTTGGYGLHLRPVDLAKLGFLLLQRGKWSDQQLLPESWVASSTTQQVQKQDGSGYGYLWTVYPKPEHYAALGLGGQQIHVYPAQNLVVIVTAGLEAYAEAPEVEKLLAEYILPAIQSDHPLAEDPEAGARLQAAVTRAANPVRPVAPLPAAARGVSEGVYTFTENPFGWQTFELVFEPGAATAQLHLNGSPSIAIGLDNLYRRSEVQPFGALLLRGHWPDEQTFVIDYPYPLVGAPRLGELGEAELRLKFQDEDVQLTVTQRIFGGEPVSFTGSR